MIFSQITGTPMIARESSTDDPNPAKYKAFVVVIEAYKKPYFLNKVMEISSGYS